MDPTPTPAPVVVTVEPPADGGGKAACPPKASVPEAVAFTAEGTRDAMGNPPGLHRLSASRFLFVWASYEDTLRQDRVTRANEVLVSRDANGTRHVCTHVEIAAPTEVDGVRRTYDVALHLNATRGFPEGPVRVTVNWVAGCPCAKLPSGNATADFP